MPACESISPSQAVNVIVHYQLTTRLAFLPHPQATATLGTMFASPTRSPLKAKVMNTRVLSLRCVLPVSSRLRRCPPAACFPLRPTLYLLVLRQYMLYMSPLTLLLMPSPGFRGKIAACVIV